MRSICPHLPSSAFDHAAPLQAFRTKWQASGAADVDAIAAHFAGKKTAKRVKAIGELLETLRALGVGWGRLHNTVQGCRDCRSGPQ